VTALGARQVVVGLGNPGSRYADTRHNLGYMVVDRLGQQGAGPWVAGPTYEFSEVTFGFGSLCLVKPTTYMNGSGMAVADALLELGAATEGLLVVLDDIHLETGQIRLRRSGSDGGHNGLQSVIDSLGDQGFPRLRLGIGAPGESGDLIDFVLGEFPPEEREAVQAQVSAAADCVRCWSVDGLDAAMNRYNAREYPAS